MKYHLITYGWLLKVHHDTTSPTDAERLEIIMQTFSLEAEKNVRVE
jgi:hypothetical protein